MAASDTLDRIRREIDVRLRELRPQVQEYATIEAFESDPEKVWGFYALRYRALTDAQPNDAHLALAELERRGIVSAVITQNIDLLHERAGSHDVIEVHGSVELMYPEFGKPVSLFLDTGLATHADVTRKAAQISTASAFVVPHTVRTYGGLPDAPEITAAMSNFDLEWKGSFFEMYRRRAGTPAAAH